MEIYWRLMFGHMLGDFTFQTNFINRWKRTSAMGLLVHCLMHPLFYIPLTWDYLPQYWIDTEFIRLNGWACVAVIFALHWLEDWWRVSKISQRSMPDNTAFFAWDQIVHLSVIFSVAPMAIVAAVSPALFPEKWPILGCLFVLVTHGCTVLIYFLEKDLHGAEYPGSEEKHLAMAERLVLALCFLFPSALGSAALASLWLGVMFLIRRKRFIDLTPFTFYAGAVVAVLSGLAARAIYLP